MVYIVLRNHNAFSLTSQCIQSLSELTYPNYRILVIDDGSTDDSADKISDIFPEVQLKKTGRYLEYCKSFNVGIRIALDNKAEYVFLVNNDTKDFSLNYLDEIIHSFKDNDKIGLIGSYCYDYGGKVRWNGDAKEKFGISMETPTEGYIIRSDVFHKIGLLDENLVRYFEDLDFIVRLRKKGYVTKSVTSVSFAHLGGGTSSKQIFIPNYYRVRNIIWFMKKYCRNKSFSWKIRTFLSNLINPHINRIYVSLIKTNFKSFIMLNYSIIAGIIMGFITKWTEKNDI